MNNKGIALKDEDADTVTLEVQAGEIWDDFVRYCVSNNYYGVENLSYIPGTVGATPVQNIGAYGSEVKDCISKVYAVDIYSLENKTFTNQECQFSYRNSIFKQTKKYIITKVEFVLKKHAKLNLEYANLKNILADNLSISQLRNEIIKIRKNKLPDPQEIPNAGSFFKNPIVELADYELLKRQNPKLVSFKTSDGKMKLAAGQLIEFAGYKGYTNGRVGVHDKQALVLVKHENGTGQNVAELAKEIQTKIFQKFNINLEPEVLIL